MNSHKTHRKHTDNRKSFERKWLIVGAIVVLSICIPIYVSFLPGFITPSPLAGLAISVWGTLFLIYAVRGVVKFALLDKHGFIKFLHNEFPLSYLKRRGSVYPDESSYWFDVIGRFVILVFGSTFLIIGMVGIIRSW